MTIGTASTVFGFADVFGGHMFNTIDYTGPASYTNTGVGATSGDSPLSHRMFGFENTIECIIDVSIDQTGTYFAQDQPVNNGVTSWRLRWFVLSTGAEVANGVNLSGITIKVAAIGY